MSRDHERPFVGRGLAPAENIARKTTPLTRYAGALPRGEPWESLPPRGRWRRSRRRGLAPAANIAYFADIADDHAGSPLRADNNALPSPRGKVAREASRMRVSFRRTQHLCFLVSGVINPHPSCPVGRDTRLATARSRSRSDNALRCHSLRSRRFATPRGRREGIGLLKYHLLFRYRGSIWNAPLRQSLRHAYGVPPPFTQGRLWVVRDLSAADNPCRGRPPGRPEISPILPISRAFTERPYGGNNPS